MAREPSPTARAVCSNEESMNIGERIQALLAFMEETRASIHRLRV